MHITEENLKKLRSKIKHYEQNYLREKNSVQLMAVSKKKPAELIEVAYNYGQRIFGESYVQEALGKMALLQNFEDIEWHFIGPIQSNKTRDISQHFDWVHSVDRLKIIKRLNEQRGDDKTPLNVCIQINSDKEETKSGFLQEDLLEAAQQVVEANNLTLRGLMAIPKPSDSLEKQRAAFFKIQQWYKKLQTLSADVDTLSIGMSGDIEAAIAEGSTIVRVGTAIFGQRDIN